MEHWILGLVISYALLCVTITLSQNCVENSKYRSLDGACNNVKNPYWGSAPRTHDALVALDYGDGKICPREAKKGTTALPLAREVSLNILYKSDKPDDENDLSETHIYFGMLLAHDFALSYPTDTPSVPYPCPAKTAKCPLHELYIGENDKYFNTTCVEIAVNKGIYCDGTNQKDCGCPKCAKGQFQHQNFMTSAIDLSNIYAIDRKRNQEVRVPGSAKFKMTKDDLIPLSSRLDTSPFPCLQPDRTGGPCLETADALGNIAPNLEVVHTNFLRYHNYLVDNLKSIFTDQETLFEEARRINIAVWQRIIYREYLPTIFGSCMSEDLKVPTKNYKYDPNIDFTVTKEFITAAFRFGHTQPKNYATVGFNNEILSLGSTYSLTPYQTLGPDVIDKMMYGMLKDRAKTSDRFYVEQSVNNFTFSVLKQASDLAAIDVERARLHGLATYGKIRKCLSLSVPQTYEELKKLVPADVVAKLKQAYGDDGLENLDMFVVGLAENKEPRCKGILFGETFRTIIDGQFRKAKFGDRFWYERMDQRWSFTEEQLAEIHKTTLSGVLCATTNLKTVQTEAFKSSSPKMSCNKIKEETKINFDVWRKSDSKNCGFFNFWCHFFSK